MYFFILFFCIFLIVGLNLIFSFSWLTLLYLFLSFVVVLLPALPFAFIIRVLPKKWFNYQNKNFQVKKWERDFYLKIKIRSWKDKIPELGKTVEFRKDKLEDAESEEYLIKFLTETCYAEVLHITVSILGLVFMWIMFFVNTQAFLTMTLPVAFVFTCYNVPSTIIQRYNRPRLEISLKRLQI